MANYNLSAQLTYAALDLLRVAGENETLQKLEDVHEILRDATTDDRLLAVRNLTGSLRLRLIRVIHAAYCAAPSEFSTEFPALLDEHAEFARAVLCYDGAPDDYRRAHALFLFKGGDSFRKNRPLWNPKRAQEASPLTCHCGLFARPTARAAQRTSCQFWYLFDLAYSLLRLAAPLIINEAASLNGLDAFCP